MPTSIFLPLFDHKNPSLFKIKANSPKNLIYSKKQLTLFLQIRIMRSVLGTELFSCQENKKWLRSSVG
ncbi:hypothetical protein CSW98_10645 [Vibrio sp. HA2012]|nr:hypothetical protein CSW98_10645 [Vibrio sp. HA2012]